MCSSPLYGEATATHLSSMSLDVSGQTTAITNRIVFDAVWAGCAAVDMSDAGLSRYLFITDDFLLSLVTINSLGKMTDTRRSIVPFGTESYLNLASNTIHGQFSTDYSLFMGFVEAIPNLELTTTIGLLLNLDKSTQLTAALWDDLYIGDLFTDSTITVSPIWGTSSLTYSAIDPTPEFGTVGEVFTFGATDDYTEMYFNKNDWMLLSDGSNQCEIGQGQWPVFLLACPLYDVAGEECDLTQYVDLSEVNTALTYKAIACTGGLMQGYTFDWIEGTDVIGTMPVDFVPTGDEYRF
jgi:hypothetical protein